MDTIAFFEAFFKPDVNPSGHPNFRMPRGERSPLSLRGMYIFPGDGDTIREAEGKGVHTFGLVKNRAGVNGVLWGAVSYHKKDWLSQISQLSIFDYVNGITIGSIAAEMATELENPLRPLLAMGGYGALVALTSFATTHSARWRRWLTGRTLVLLENGTLYRENLKKAKLDVNEFLTQCRDGGFFDLNDIQLALLETTGRISFLPKSERKPASPQELGLSVPAAQMPVNVIVDGESLPGNLEALGFSEDWLDGQLADRNLTVGQVFLAVCDLSGALTLFPMETAAMERDWFL